jgi:uncharacterized protein (TIGR02145 family)
MKNKTNFLGILFTALFLFFVCSCSKDDEKNVPVLTTAEVTQIAQTAATSGGNITDDWGATVTARGVCWSTSQNPTINDSKTEDGTGAGTFTSSISGLEASTTYYVRAYATNSSGTGYGSAMSFTSTGAVDADGNVYSTVVIDNLEWFAENLKTTRYNNGSPIPNVTSNSDWGTLTSGAYAWYENNEATYKNTYGALYNWYAVNTGNLCPAGWRVPTDEEWTTLTNYAGGGGKLKNTRTAPDAHPRWESPNTGATDEYGFAALPGSYRSYDGSFGDVGFVGTWWSSSEFLTAAWLRRFDYNYSDLKKHNYNKEFGLSVRCLRDL